MKTTHAKLNAGLLLLLIAYYSFIVIGMPGAALNIAWEHMQDTFTLSLDQIGVLLFFGSMSYMAVTFTSGPLIGRFGLGRFLLGFTLCEALGLLGMAFAPSWEALLAANLVLGAGSGALDAGINAYAVTHFRANYVNWLHACYGVGSTIGPLLVTLLVADLGQPWQFSYVVMAGGAFVLAALLLLTLRRWRLNGAADAEAEEDAPNVDIRRTLALPALWLGMAFFLLCSGLEAGGGQLNSALFIDGRGIDERMVGIWITTYWGAFTVGRFLLGGMVAVVGKLWMVRGCLAGAVVGAGLIWWNPAEPVSTIGLVLMGFAISILFPTVIADTPKRFGKAHAANAVGLQIGAANVGVFLVPGIGGALGERVGLAAISPFLFAVAVALLLIHEALIRRGGA